MSVRLAWFLGLVTVTACRPSPGAPVVSISPAQPTTRDALQAVVQEEEGLSYVFRWFRDGIEAAPNTAALPETLTAKGETWKVLVVAYDGEADGPPGDAEVIIVNTTPAVAVTLAPTAPGADDDLVATPWIDEPDDDVVSLAWTWTVDGSASGQTSETVPASAIARGQTWAVSVVPSDDEATGEAATASVLVGDAPPVVTGLVLSPDPAFEASILTTEVTAEDVEADPVTFTYAWSVEGEVVQEGDAATLAGTLFDKHDEVTVAVTPNDGFADGETVTSDVLTISNTPPVLAGASLDPETPTTDTPVTCVPVGWSDDDGDTEGYTFAWTINGVDAGADATLDAALFVRGDVLSCTVTPFDGEETGTPAGIAATVANTAPVLASATLSTTAPTVADTLSVTLGSASDADGDEVSFGYAWYVDGDVAGTSDTLTGESFHSGDAVWVEVTPFDGMEYGTPVVSDTAVVVGTAP